MHQDDNKEAVNNFFMELLFKVYWFVICFDDENFVNHGEQCELDDENDNHNRIHAAK